MDHDHFFIRIPILCLETFWSILSKKTHVLVVTGELIWLLFLNILSFNYVQTTNKSLRFRKFRRSYTYTSLLSFKPTTMKCRLILLLDAHCRKRLYSILCCCLPVTIVHLRNLFLLNTLVAQMLLTPRWVSRRKMWIIYSYIYDN